MMKSFLAILSIIVFSSISKAVVIPIDTIPDKLVVHSLTKVNQNRVGKLVLDALYKIGNNNIITPNLARSIKTANAGKDLTLTIKAFKFSDGTQGRIEHVYNSIKFCIKNSQAGHELSLSKIKGYSNFKSGKTKTIEGLTIQPPNQLKFSLNAKSPLLFDFLSHLACAIVKPSSKGSRDLLSGALGTGAYTLINRTKSSIYLVKNRYYWTKNSGPDLVEFKTFEKKNSEELKEQADLIMSNKDDKALSNFNKHRYTRLGSYHLVFNNSKKPLNDPEIRKAISHLINFETLAKKLNWDANRIQEGLFSFGMRGFKKREMLSPRKNLGQKILLSKGYSKESPLKLKLTVPENKNVDLRSVWSLAFESKLLSIEVLVVPKKLQMETRDKGTFDMLFIGKAPGSIDPFIILSSLLKGSEFNTPRASEKECDLITRSALLELMYEKRYKLYQKAEACYLSKHIVVPLTSLKSGYVFLKKPWRIPRTNQYLLDPFRAQDWIKDEQ